MFNGYNETPLISYNDFEQERGKKHQNVPKWSYGNASNMQPPQSHNHHPEFWPPKSTFLGLPNVVSLSKCSCAECYSAPENRGFHGDSRHRSWLSRTFPVPLNGSNDGKSVGYHHWENANSSEGSCALENSGAGPQFPLGSGEKAPFYRPYISSRPSDHQPGVITSMKNASKDDNKKPPSDIITSPSGQEILLLGQNNRQSVAFDNHGYPPLWNSTKKESEGNYCDQNEKYTKVEPYRQHSSVASYSLEQTVSRHPVAEPYIKTVPSNSTQNRVPSTGHRNIKESIPHSYLDQTFDSNKMVCLNPGQMINGEKGNNRTTYQTVAKEIMSGSESLQNGQASQLSSINQEGKYAEYPNFGTAREFATSSNTNSEVEAQKLQYMNKNSEFFARNAFGDVMKRNGQNCIPDIKKDGMANQNNSLSMQEQYCNGLARSNHVAPKYWDSGNSKISSCGIYYPKDYVGHETMPKTDGKIGLSGSPRENMDCFQRSDDVFKKDASNTSTPSRLSRPIICPTDPSNARFQEKGYGAFPYPAGYRNGRRPEYPYPRYTSQGHYEYPHNISSFQRSEIPTNNNQYNMRTYQHSQAFPGIDQYGPPVSNNFTYESSCQQSGLPGKAFPQPFSETNNHAVSALMRMDPQLQQHYAREPTLNRSADVHPLRKPSYLETIRSEEMCRNGTSKISPLRLMRKKKFLPNQADLVPESAPPPSAPNEGAPALDVRRFWATWADEEEEYVTPTQMVVLDCQNIDPEQAELLHLYDSDPIRAVQLDEGSIVAIKDPSCDKIINEQGTDLGASIIEVESGYQNDSVASDRRVDSQPIDKLSLKSGIHPNPPQNSDKIEAQKEGSETPTNLVKNHTNLNASPEPEQSNVEWQVVDSKNAISSNDPTVVKHISKAHKRGRSHVSHDEKGLHRGKKAVPAKELEENRIDKWTEKKFDFLKRAEESKAAEIMRNEEEKKRIFGKRKFSAQLDTIPEMKNNSNSEKGEDTLDQNFTSHHKGQSKGENDQSNNASALRAGEPEPGEIVRTQASPDSKDSINEKESDKHLVIDEDSLDGSQSGDTPAELPTSEYRKNKFLDYSEASVILNTSSIPPNGSKEKIRPMLVKEDGLEKIPASSDSNISGANQLNRFMDSSYEERLKEKSDSNVKSPSGESIKDLTGLTLDAVEIKNVGPKAKLENATVNSEIDDILKKISEINFSSPDVKSEDMDNSDALEEHSDHSSKTEKPKKSKKLSRKTKKFGHIENGKRTGQPTLEDTTVSKPTIKFSIQKTHDLKISFKVLNNTKTCERPIADDSDYSEATKKNQETKENIEADGEHIETTLNLKSALRDKERDKSTGSRTKNRKKPKKKELPDESTAMKTPVLKIKKSRYMMKKNGSDDVPPDGGEIYSGNQNKDSQIDRITSENAPADDFQVHETVDSAKIKLTFKRHKIGLEKGNKKLYGNLEQGQIEGTERIKSDADFPNETVICKTAEDAAVKKRGPANFQSSKKKTRRTKSPPSHKIDEDLYKSGKVPLRDSQHDKVFPEIFRPAESTTDAHTDDAEEATSHSTYQKDEDSPELNEVSSKEDITAPDMPPESQPFCLVTQSEFCVVPENESGDVYQSQASASFPKSPMTEEEQLCDLSCDEVDPLMVPAPAESSERSPGLEAADECNELAGLVDKISEEVEKVKEAEKEEEKRDTDESEIQDEKHNPDLDECERNVLSDAPGSKNELLNEEFIDDEEDLTSHSPHDLSLRQAEEKDVEVPASKDIRWDENQDSQVPPNDIARFSQGLNVAPEENNSVTIQKEEQANEEIQEEEQEANKEEHKEEASKEEQEQEDEEDEEDEEEEEVVEALNLSKDKLKNEDFHDKGMSIALEDNRKNNVGIEAETSSAESEKEVPAAEEPIEFDFANEKELSEMRSYSVKESGDDVQECSGPRDEIEKIAALDTPTANEARKDKCRKVSVIRMKENIPFQLPMKSATSVEGKREAEVTENNGLLLCNENTRMKQYVEGEPMEAKLSAVNHNEPSNVENEDDASVPNYNLVENQLESLFSESSESKMDVVVKGLSKDIPLKSNSNQVHVIVDCTNAERINESRKDLNNDAEINLKDVNDLTEEYQLPNFEKLSNERADDFDVNENRIQFVEESDIGHTITNSNAGSNVDDGVSLHSDDTSTDNKNHLLNLPDLTSEAVEAAEDLELTATTEKSGNKETRVSNCSNAIVTNEDYSSHFKLIDVEWTEKHNTETEAENVISNTVVTDIQSEVQMNLRETKPIKDKEENVLISDGVDNSKESGTGISFKENKPQNSCENSDETLKSMQSDENENLNCIYGNTGKSENGSSLEKNEETNDVSENHRYLPASIILNDVDSSVPKIHAVETESVEVGRELIDADKSSEDHKISTEIENENDSYEACIQEKIKILRREALREELKKVNPELDLEFVHESHSKLKASKPRQIRSNSSAHELILKTRDMKSKSLPRAMKFNFRKNETDFKETETNIPVWDIPLPPGDPQKENCFDLAEFLRKCATHIAELPAPRIISKDAQNVQSNKINDLKNKSPCKTDSAKVETSMKRMDKEKTKENPLPLLNSPTLSDVSSQSLLSCVENCNSPFVLSGIQKFRNPSPPFDEENVQNRKRAKELLKHPRVDLLQKGQGSRNPSPPSLKFSSSDSRSSCTSKTESEDFDFSKSSEAQKLSSTPQSAGRSSPLSLSRLVTSPEKMTPETACTRSSSIESFVVQLPSGIANCATKEKPNDTHHVRTPSPLRPENKHLYVNCNLSRDAFLVNSDNLNAEKKFHQDIVEKKTITSDADIRKNFESVGSKVLVNLASSNSSKEEFGEIQSGTDETYQSVIEDIAEPETNGNEAMVEDTTVDIPNSDISFEDNIFITDEFYKGEALSSDEPVSDSLPTVEEIEEEKVSEDKFRNVMQNCLENAKKFLNVGNLKLFSCSVEDLLEIDCRVPEQLSCLVEIESSAAAAAESANHFSRDVLLTSCDEPPNEELVMSETCPPLELSMDFEPFFGSEATHSLCPEILPVDNWPYLEEEVPSSPTKSKMEDSVLLSPPLDNIPSSENPVCLFDPLKNLPDSQNIFPHYLSDKTFFYQNIKSKLMELQQNPGRLTRSRSRRISIAAPERTTLAMAKYFRRKSMASDRHTEGEAVGSPLKRRKTIDGITGTIVTRKKVFEEDESLLSFQDSDTAKKSQKGGETASKLERKLKCRLSLDRLSVLEDDMNEKQKHLNDIEETITSEDVYLPEKDNLSGSEIGLADFKALPNTKTDKIKLPKNRVNTDESKIKSSNGLSRRYSKDSGNGGSDSGACKRRKGSVDSNPCSPVRKTLPKENCLETKKKESAHNGYMSPVWQPKVMLVRISDAKVSDAALTSLSKNGLPAIPSSNTKTLAIGRQNSLEKSSNISKNELSTPVDDENRRLALKNHLKKSKKETIASNVKSRADQILNHSSNSDVGFNKSKIYVKPDDEILHDIDHGNNKNLVLKIDRQKLDLGNGVILKKISPGQLKDTALDDKANHPPASDHSENGRTKYLLTHEAKSTEESLNNTNIISTNPINSVDPRKRKKPRFRNLHTKRKRVPDTTTLAKETHSAAQNNASDRLEVDSKSEFDEIGSRDPPKRDLIAVEKANAKSSSNISVRQNSQREVKEKKSNHSERSRKDSGQSKSESSTSSVKKKGSEVDQEKISLSQKCQRNECRSSSTSRESKKVESHLEPNRQSEGESGKHTSKSISSSENHSRKESTKSSHERHRDSKRCDDKAKIKNERNSSQSRERSHHEPESCRKSEKELEEKDPVRKHDETEVVDRTKKKNEEIDNKTSSYQRSKKHHRKEDPKRSITEKGDEKEKRHSEEKTKKSKTKEDSDQAGSWICEVCGFDDVKLRTEHIQSHSFHCQSCHLAFKTESYFISHLTKKHKDIRNQHHCLLCELSFDAEDQYHEHLESREHRHLESVEKNTINTLFTLLTGQPCPVLGPVEVKPEWLPSQAGTVHFYHQATPLSLALQYLKMRHDTSTNTTTSSSHPK